MNAIEQAADADARGGTSTGDFGPITPETVDSVRRCAFVRGAKWVQEQVLAGIAREQNYREYRQDQDGSGVGACKEIAGYVRALSGSASQNSANPREDAGAEASCGQNRGHTGSAAEEAAGVGEAGESHAVISARRSQPVASPTASACQPDLAELKALAEKATPGPWIRRYYDRVTPPDDTDGTKSIAHIYGSNCIDRDPRNTAAFIAAANPATVLALIERVSAYQAKQGKVWVIEGHTFGSGCYWAPGPIDYVRDIRYAVKFVDQESAEEVRKTLHSKKWRVVETACDDSARNGGGT